MVPLIPDRSLDLQRPFIFLLGGYIYAKDWTKRNIGIIGSRL